MLTLKAIRYIFPVWGPRLNKDFVKKQILGNKILETIGINRGKEDYERIEL